tara:strand:- start:2307 stop:2645 length:339 start_codon:yes stop_codon:yes gene_type:complete
MASRISRQQLQAAKKTAKKSGTLPEKQPRRRRRRSRGGTGRKFTFNYDVGDLVILNRIPHGMPCKKGDMVLIAEADHVTGQFGISTPHGVIAIDGKCLRPVEEWDEDDEEAP